MPDDEIERLRSVLSRAYEKHQPFLVRLIQAVKDRVSSRIPERKNAPVERLPSDDKKRVA